MNKTYLSVVIPCFNEMSNLQKGVLDKLEHYLSKQKYSSEVIIVDDGSTDGSTQFIKRFAAEDKHFILIENQHLGKAGATTAGMLAANGEYRIFTDMDQATPIEEVEKLLPFVNKYDIVIGSRQSQRKGAPLSRKIMAQGMISLRKLIVGIKNIDDTQCGFKIFKAEVAEKIFTQLKTMHNGFKTISGSSVKAGFDVELLYLATKKGFSIKEVPVHWLYVESRRVSPIKDSLEGVEDLIRIRLNAMTKKY